MNIKKKIFICYTIKIYIFIIFILYIEKIVDFLFYNL